MISQPRSDRCCHRYFYFSKSFSPSEVPTIFRVHSAVQYKVNSVLLYAVIQWAKAAKTIGSLHQLPRETAQLAEVGDDLFTVVPEIQYVNTMHKKMYGMVLAWCDLYSYTAGICCVLILGSVEGS